jgi:hypothetical protein
MFSIKIFWRYAEVKVVLLVGLFIITYENYFSAADFEPAGVCPRTNQCLCLDSWNQRICKYRTIKTPTNDVNTHTYSYTGGGNNVARF